MQLFFRVFLIGLVLLCSCNSGLFVEPKSKTKPYYFSYKTGRPTQSAILATAVGNSAAVEAKPENSNTVAKEKNSSTSSSTHAEFTVVPKPTETRVSGRFTEVKSQAKAPQYQPQKPAAKLRTRKPNADAGLLFGASVLALFMGGLVALFQPKARNIAGWAKANKKKSWLLIGVGHILLGFGGSFAGRVLHELGFLTSEISLYALLGVAAVAALSVPAKGTKSKTQNHTFLRSRLAFLALLFSGFFLFLNLANRNAADKNISPLSTKIEQATQYDEVLVTATAETLASLPDGLASPQAFDIWAFLLILLALAAFFMLMYALTVVSCLILCAGAGLLALAVFLGGTAFFIYLLILTFRVIIDGANTRKEKPLRFKEQDSEPDKPEAAPPPEPRPKKYKYNWF